MASTDFPDRRRESLNLLKRQLSTMSGMDDVLLREAKRYRLGSVGNDSNVIANMKGSLPASMPLSLMPFSFAQNSSSLPSLSNSNVSRSLLFNASLKNDDTFNTNLLSANNSTSSLMNSLDNNQRQEQLIRRARLAMLSQSLSTENQVPQEMSPRGLLQEQLQLEALLKQRQLLNSNLSVQDFNSRSFSDEILSTAAGGEVHSRERSIHEGLQATNVNDHNERSSDQLPPTSLYMPCDDDYLSEYQIVLRKQIEFFQAGETEMEAVAHTRQTKVKLGKVGIRCKHCAKLAPTLRPKGSVYYPGHLKALYQAAQNMAKTHFGGRCMMIDKDLQTHMQKLASNKTMSGHVGRKYWSDCAKSIGIIELESGGLSYCKKVA